MPEGSPQPVSSESETAKERLEKILETEPMLKQCFQQEFGAIVCVPVDWKTLHNRHEKVYRNLYYIGSKDDGFRPLIIEHKIVDSFVTQKTNTGVGPVMERKNKQFSVYHQDIVSLDSQIFWGEGYRIYLYKPNKDAGINQDPDKINLENFGEPEIIIRFPVFHKITPEPDLIHKIGKKFHSIGGETKSMEYGGNSSISFTGGAILDGRTIEWYNNFENFAKMDAEWNTRELSEGELETLRGRAELGP